MKRIVLAKNKILKKKDYKDCDINIKKMFKKHLNLSYFNIIKEFPILFSIQAKYGKRKETNLSPQSVLIINSSLIGDFINSLPAIKYFVNQHKNCEIDLIVAPPLLSLSKNIEGIRSVVSMKTIFQKAKSEELPLDKLSKKYDLVIIMRIPKNILPLLKAIDFREIRTYLGVYLKLGLKFMENNSSKKVVKQMREINFEVIGDTDFHDKRIDASELFKFEESDSKNIRNSEILQNLNETKKVLIHTGSGWEIKFWSVQKWIDLINAMTELGNFSFIFVGANRQEEEYFNEIQKGLNIPVYSIIKKFDIKDTLLFMKNCNYFIGVDSGLRHLAHLINLPSISLLGPGQKNFEPLNDKGLVIDKATKCMCTNLVCFMPETCLEQITVGEVLDLIKKNWIE